MNLLRSVDGIQWAERACVAGHVTPCYQAEFFFLFEKVAGSFLHKQRSLNVILTNNMILLGQSTQHSRSGWRTHNVLWHNYATVCWKSLRFIHLLLCVPIDSVLMITVCPEPFCFICFIGSFKCYWRVMHAFAYKHTHMFTLYRIYFI